MAFTQPENINKAPQKLCRNVIKIFFDFCHKKCTIAVHIPPAMAIYIIISVSVIYKFLLLKKLNF
jgi:hypothetical protein